MKQWLSTKEFDKFVHLETLAAICEHNGNASEMRKFERKAIKLMKCAENRKEDSYDN